MKYRKKPVVIDAFKYEGNLKNSDGGYCVPDWAAAAFESGVMHHYSPYKYPNDTTLELFIDTLEGMHHVSVGDYIIKGVNGELYPCKPDIFRKTYEEVEE